MVVLPGAGFRGMWIAPFIGNEKGADEFGCGRGGRSVAVSGAFPVLADWLSRLASGWMFMGNTCPLLGPRGVSAPALVSDLNF